MKAKVKGKYKRKNINRPMSYNDPLVFQKNKSKKALNPTYSVDKTRQMNWKQLKQKFPGMNPNSDADFDGLVNAKDCKPLDPSKDGAFSRFLGVITSGERGQSKEEYKAERSVKSTTRFERKMEKDISRAKDREEVKKLKAYRREKFREVVGKVEKVTRPSRVAQWASQQISRKIRERVLTKRKDIAAAIVRRERGVAKAVERFAGVKGVSKEGKAAKGQKQAGAGRPKQSYKYRDPRTGQPISAVEYHRLRKQLKSQAKAVETQTEVKQRFALARRGLSPEEVSQAQEEINARMARLRAIKEAKQQGIQPEEISGQDVEQQVIQEEAQQIPTEVIQEAQPQVIQQQQRVPHIEPMTAVPGSYGIPPGYRLRQDLMTGRKTLVPLPPREAWTR